MVKKRKSANGVGNGKRRVKRAWSKEDHKELKKHSKSKTRVSVISRAMKRTPAALRQQAFKLGLGLGHQR